MSNWLKMRGVNAVFDFAPMVQFQPFGDGSNQQLIGESVCEGLLAFCRIEKSVSARGNTVPVPEPAGSSFGDESPEPVLNRQSSTGLDKCGVSVVAPSLVMFVAPSASSNGALASIDRTQLSHSFIVGDPIKELNHG